MNIQDTVNADLPMPKHHRVYLLLLDKLKSGGFADGIPGEIELMKIFGVARVTVRRALGRLAAEGLIERAPKRGTQPTANSKALCDLHLRGLFGDLVNVNLKFSVQVLTCERNVASEPVRNALKLPKGEFVIKSVRLRSSRYGPVSHLSSHIPAYLARGIDLRDPAPLMLLLKNAGIEVDRARQKLSAELADATVGPLLGVDVGSALLSVTRIFFKTDGVPVLLQHGLYRPDRYQYEMEMTQQGDVDARVWISQEPALALTTTRPVNAAKQR